MLAMRIPRLIVLLFMVLNRVSAIDENDEEKVMDKRALTWYQHRYSEVLGKHAHPERERRLQDLNPLDNCRLFSAPDTCAARDAAPLCLPFRSATYCSPNDDFLKLVSERRETYRNNPSPDYWYHFLEDKGAANILSENYPRPRIHCCITSPLEFEDCIVSNALENVPIVIKADKLHSDNGIFVFSLGFSLSDTTPNVDILSGATYILPELVAALSNMNYSKIIVEEFVPGYDGGLPVEYKFHMFGDRIGAIDVVANKGVMDCSCYAVVDADWDRLDKNGCFESSGESLAPTNGCIPVDTEAGATNVGPIKRNMGLCDDVEKLRPPACLLGDMVAIARDLGRTIGVYMRVDMFLGKNGRIVVNEYSPNHMNGIRHCASVTTRTGCIDACFMGKLWSLISGGNGAPLDPAPTSMIHGGEPSPAPFASPTDPKLRDWDKQTPQEQCARVIRSQSTIPTYTQVCTTDTPSTSPTRAPIAPTPFPTTSPTPAPTTPPTKRPTKSPTSSPTGKPTTSPSGFPSASPSIEPTSLPSRNPSLSPTAMPTKAPTPLPTPRPTALPPIMLTPPVPGMTLLPTGILTSPPTATPSAAPTESPTKSPSAQPTGGPTQTPTFRPTGGPSAQPTSGPTGGPTLTPTEQPTKEPTFVPTNAAFTNPPLVPQACTFIRKDETDCDKVAESDEFCNFFWNEVQVKEDGQFLAELLFNSGINPIMTTIEFSIYATDSNGDVKLFADQRALPIFAFTRGIAFSDDLYPFVTLTLPSGVITGFGGIIGLSLRFSCGDSIQFISLGGEMTVPKSEGGLAEDLTSIDVTPGKETVMKGSKRRGRRRQRTRKRRRLQEEISIAHSNLSYQLAGDGCAHDGYGWQLLPPSIGAINQAQTIMCPCVFPQEVVFISEVMYGTENQDFVEIGSTYQELDNFELEFYDGEDQKKYKTVQLKDARNITIIGGMSFLVVEDLELVNPAKGVGAAVALVDKTTSRSTVLEFLSYEGTFKAADGSAKGQYSRNVANVDAAQGLSFSLGRGTGCFPSDFENYEVLPGTKGEPTENQVFSCAWKDEPICDGPRN